MGPKKGSRTIVKPTSKSITRCIKKYSPKALRVLKTNKAPVILDKQFALKQKPYSELDLATIQKRAKLVRENENFCKNIQIINREAAEERNKQKPKKIYYQRKLFMRNLFRIKILHYLKLGIAHLGKTN